ncbi:hypothetical protein ACFL4N_02575 [Thermodesulfobacteriota bacterium]
MVVAKGDDHTLWDLELQTFTEIRTAQKKLTVPPRITHMRLYAIRKNLEIAATAGVGKLKTHL